MRAAAFFDLDKTVIAKASMLAFGRTLYREGLISRRVVARALYGQLVYMHLGADEEKLARMRDSVLALIKGWERKRMREIVVEALEEVIEPIIYAEALTLIRSHQEAGHEVWVVSASPEEIVEPLGRYLGVDGVIATRAAVDEDGRYTGGVEFYAYGPYKAEAMRRLAAERDLDLDGSWAYSDSATDAPMLEAVGHPVAVNPDRDLLRVARSADWEVRRFERPVHLRSRLPVPPPGATTAAGALLTAAAVGGGVWLRLRLRRLAPPVPPPPSGWDRVRRSLPVAVDGQSMRSFLAATTPRPTRMASNSSFFMRAR